MTATGAISDRAQREREAYNEGLDRASYEDFFSHTHYLYERRRQALIRQTLQPIQDGVFLELGSSVWVPWLEQNSIRPRSLICINISETELRAGSELASMTEVKPIFKLMDANHLSFPAESFDAVYGGGILHHLDYEQALSEVHRVLRPGGVMIFREPLDVNPIGKVVRALTPKARTEDERPLRLKELALLKRLFVTELHFEQLTTVIGGVASRFLFKSPDNALTRAAFALDEWFVRTCPPLGPFCREVVIVGTKPTRPVRAS